MQTTLLDESLVVVYRVLFLLFAEARGLVPVWHPTFRDSYTIDSLRHRVETLPRPRGVWEALQAIARLAHRGCHAGSLRVPPFNGRLFLTGSMLLSPRQCRSTKRPSAMPCSHSRLARPGHRT